MRALFVATLLCWVVTFGSASARDHAVVRGFIRADITLTVQDPDGGGEVKLVGMVTRPDAPGRAPLMLINHGRNSKTMNEEDPWIYAGQAMDFARRGWAVVVVVRRGYGRSGGSDHESAGPCDKRRFLEAGNAAADDVIASLEQLRREPWVDPKRILLVGQSAGGFAVTAAAARNPPGVVGFIDFAGGNGSDGKNHVCGSDRLVAAEGRFGQTTKVPSLWIYTENDHYFEPALARSMADAFAKSGAPVEFHLEAPFGEDGHTFFARGAKRWRPIVEAFLRAHGWPADVVIELPTIPPPSALNAKGREGFADYLASTSFEKAFAMTDTGAWGWWGGEETTEKAREKALETCAKHGSGCHVVAIGNASAQ